MAGLLGQFGWAFKSFWFGFWVERWMDVLGLFLAYTYVYYVCVCMYLYVCFVCVSYVFRGAGYMFDISQPTQYIKLIKLP